jgi:hypothetical protein
VSFNVCGQRGAKVWQASVEALVRCFRRARILNTPFRKSRTGVGKQGEGRLVGPNLSSISDVNARLRQAEAAFNESTRKMNLLSAQTLRAYLALRSHEQLVKLFDQRLTTVDRRQLLAAIKNAIPNRPLSRSSGARDSMKVHAMHGFRNFPAIVVFTMFASVLGFVGLQAWRNTARVLVFPEQRLVLAMPDGSFRSVLIPSGTRLSVVDHDHGDATVRIWKDKIGYATSRIRLTAR